MVFEFFGLVDRHEYIGSEPRIPGLEVEVREPVSGGKRKFIAPVDTGFAGHLLVPIQTYADLATMELPQEDFGSYSTMAGPITLRRAEVELEIEKGRIFNSFIETPLQGEGKLLAGRRILAQLKLALLGEEMMCCQLKQVRR